MTHPGQTESRLQIMADADTKLSHLARDGKPICGTVVTNLLKIDDAETHCFKCGNAISLGPIERIEPEDN